MTTYATWTDERLDLAIAERIYGVKEPQIDGWRMFGWKGDPEASTVTNHSGARPTCTLPAAFDVIDAMRKRGWRCRIESPDPNVDGSTWTVTFIYPPESAKSVDVSPQRATCIAALRALDAEKESRDA